MPLLLLVGCGSEAAPPPAVCEAEAALVEPLPSSAIAGFVRVRDTRDLTLDDQGTPRETAVGRVQAGFADLTSVTSTPAALMTLGPYCVGLVSRPVSAGARVPLDLGALVVEGTGRGTVQAIRTSTGTFVVSGEPLLSSAPLRITGEAPAEGGFPPFSETLAPIDRLEVEAPRLDGRGELGAGDLVVAWSAGDGDFIELRLEPPAGEVSSGGQVLCRVADRGCFTLPAAATTFLLSAGAREYEMILSRHRYRAVRPTAESSLDLSAVDEVELTLQNGGFE